MEIKVAEKEEEEGSDSNSNSNSNKEEDETLPLLLPEVPNTETKTMVQRAISQTFQSTAHLANLLPTGTVLAFQLLSPVFSNQGECDPVSRFMTAWLVAMCGLSCIISSFTDSFTDKDGCVCYGVATVNGLWVIDGTGTLPPELAGKYSLRFMDFVHGFMSLLVFAAVALFDQNVVSCFYPAPSKECQEILTAIPVGIGVICSMLFVVFPTKRHGIGFPLSTN
ncbi:Protein DMP4 [Linum perenne]